MGRSGLKWWAGRQLRANRFFPQSNAPISWRFLPLAAGGLTFEGSKYNRGLLANVSCRGGTARGGEVSDSIWNCPKVPLLPSKWETDKYKAGLFRLFEGSCFGIKDDMRFNFDYVSYVNGFTQ